DQHAQAGGTHAPFQGRERLRTQTLCGPWFYPWPSQCSEDRNENLVLDKVQGYTKGGGELAVESDRMVCVPPLPKGISCHLHASRASSHNPFTTCHSSGEE
ncbi:unnamed protein product, partial [Scytosiphon promiscuus]